MLDDFLPHYHFREAHRLSTTAAPPAVMNSVRELTPRELPLLVALMGLRSLPALARGRRLPVKGPIIDLFRRGGFVVLEDEPDELILGAVGRFWKASGDIRRIDPDEFRGFAEPDWAKAAVNFRVERGAGRTLLTTETRVLGTDERARRRFRRDWLVIRLASGAIRVAWLRAIRRSAERRSAD